MYLTDSFKLYLENFPTALAFALLLVFVAIFGQVHGFFVTSGSIFLGYGLVKLNTIDAAVLLGSTLLFMFFLSVFISLMIFAVRRDMSKVRLQYYLAERINKFAFKLFFFLAAFTLVLALINAMLIQFGISALPANLVMLVLAVAFLFVPQAIVIDEESLGSSVTWNFEFMRTHPGAVFHVLATGFILMFAMPLIEYAVDMLTLSLNIVPLTGNFVTLFLTLVFVVPYLEVLKTEFYMHKFELVKHSHRTIDPKRTERW